MELMSCLLTELKLEISISQTEGNVTTVHVQESTSQSMSITTTNTLTPMLSLARGEASKEPIVDNSWSQVSGLEWTDDFSGIPKCI